jgi:hypothetical protein
MVRWVDYSGAPPILLPASIVKAWKGINLPAAPDNDYPDLILPEGRFECFTDFDFDHPRTDYERACQLFRRLDADGIAQAIAVGSGEGLVFGTELDSMTWWHEQNLLVNGGGLPRRTRLSEIEWANGITWKAVHRSHILMNACDHGGNPKKDKYFKVTLVPGDYVVQPRMSTLGPALIRPGSCSAWCQSPSRCRRHQP